MFIPTLEISKELLNKEIDKFMLKDYSDLTNIIMKKKENFYQKLKIY